MCLHQFSARQTRNKKLETVHDVVFLIFKQLTTLLGPVNTSANMLKPTADMQKY